MIFPEDVDRSFFMSAQGTQTYLIRGKGQPLVRSATPNTYGIMHERNYARPKAAAQDVAPLGPATLTPPPSRVADRWARGGPSRANVHRTAGARAAVKVRRSAALPPRPLPLLRPPPCNRPSACTPCAPVVAAPR